MIMKVKSACLNCGGKTYITSIRLIKLAGKTLKCLEECGFLEFMGSTGWLHRFLLPKETTLRHVVFWWSNLAKEHPCFRPRCWHSTEGGALYCKWQNSSTDIVNTAQCASSSLSRLPRNLKIAFTFWITYVYTPRPLNPPVQAPFKLEYPLCWCI